MFSKTNKPKKIDINLNENKGGSIPCFAPSECTKNVIPNRLETARARAGILPLNASCVSVKGMSTPIRRNTMSLITVLASRVSIDGRSRLQSPKARLIASSRLKYDKIKYLATEEVLSAPSRQPSLAIVPVQTPSRDPSPQPRP